MWFTLSSEILKTSYLLILQSSSQFIVEYSLKHTHNCNTQTDHGSVLCPTQQNLLYSHLNWADWIKEISQAISSGATPLPSTLLSLYVHMSDTHYVMFGMVFHTYRLLTILSRNILVSSGTFLNREYD